MRLRGPNSVVPCFGDHRTKEMLGVVASKFDKFQQGGCSMHETSNNVGSRWPIMLCPFARALALGDLIKALRQQRETKIFEKIQNA